MENGPSFRRKVFVRVSICVAAFFLPAVLLLTFNGDSFSNLVGVCALPEATQEDHLRETSERPPEGLLTPNRNAEQRSSNKLESSSEIDDPGEALQNENASPASSPEVAMPEASGATNSFLQALSPLQSVVPFWSALSNFLSPRSDESDGDDDHLAASEASDHQSNEMVCLSPACQRVAEQMAADMNTSADPCQHADQFYCGGWLSRFTLPADESRWTVTFNSIANRTRHTIKDILEEHSCADMKQDLQGPSPVFSNWDVMSTCLYESCMDTDAIDAKGAEPLLDSLFKHADNEGLRFLVSSAFDEEDQSLGNSMPQKGQLLSSRLRAIFQHLHVLHFWGFWVMTNTLDPSKNQTIFVYDKNKGLSYHLYDARHEDLHRHYKQHNAQLLELFDDALAKYDSDLMQEYTQRNPNRRDFSFEERAERIFSFETSFRDVLLSPEEGRDVMKYTRPITYGELKKRSPLIDVEKVVSVITPLLRHPLLDSHELIIHEEDYLERVAEKLHSEDWGVIHDYLLVTTLREDAEFLSKEWRDEHHRYSKAVNGADPKPRWRLCRGMPPSWVIGRRYINEGYDKRRKEITLELLDDLKTAFTEMVSKYDWMSDETTQRALVKLEAIKEKIAYPDWLEESYETQFTKYYGPSEPALQMADDFYGCVTYMGYQSMKYQLSQFGEPEDKGEWHTAPQTVNAYYSPSMNEVSFLAAFLEEPSVYVWQKSGSSRVEEVVMRALTAGGLGGVIGHEITHGFDDSGKKYDENGKLHNWWSLESEAQFEEKAQCIEDQYSGYTVDLDIENADGEMETMSLSIRGKLTLGENIADNGGIYLAWNALKLELTKEELESKPLSAFGVDMTAAQLFMFSWGHFWCSAIRPKALRQQIETDPHSPGVFRTMGPLANFEPFAEAHSCPKGSLMNPETTCRVW